MENHQSGSRWVRRAFLRATSAILLVVVLTACHRGRPAATPSDRDPAPDRIATIVDQVATRLHVPGTAVAIVRDGRVVQRKLRGVANLEWSSPVTADTAFQIASTTKIFTGTVLLLLVQDGVIHLDAPVARYLPDAPAAWKDITVRILAAHASGIPDGPLTDATDDDAYATARAAPLAFPPGTAVRYGRTDFTILARVMERATGRRFTDLLHDRLFAPLGFTCTRFEDGSEDGMTRTAEVVPRRASVYRWSGDRQRIHWGLYPAHSYSSGGAFSCLEDLERWAIALDRGRLMTPESERLAATGFQRRDGSTGGFGVVFATSTLHGHAVYGHSGGPALGDVVRIPDEHLTVIVTANQQRALPDLAATIASVVLGAPPAATAVADPDPTLTATHTGVIDGSIRGDVPDEPFSVDGRRELVPEVREWGPIQAAPWPPRTALAFAGEHAGVAGRVREYVSWHGAAVRVRWKLTLDAAGAITGIEAHVD